MLLYNCPKGTEDREQEQKKFNPAGAGERRKDEWIKKSQFWKIGKNELWGWKVPAAVAGICRGRGGRNGKQYFRLGPRRIFSAVRRWRRFPRRHQLGDLRKRPGRRRLPDRNCPRRMEWRDSANFNPRIISGIFYFAVSRKPKFERKQKKEKNQKKNKIIYYFY